MSQNQKFKNVKREGLKSTEKFFAEEGLKEYKNYGKIIIMLITLGTVTLIPCTINFFQNFCLEVSNSNETITK